MDTNGERFMDISSDAAAMRLLQFDGAVIRPENGWFGLGADRQSLVPLPADSATAWPGTVCTPFLPAPGDGNGNPCLRLRFQAQVPEAGYWWLEFRDANGAWLPDCNSALYPEPERWRSYDEVIMLPAGTRMLQLRFVARAPLAVRDLSLSRCSLAETATWCDDIYARLPPLPPEPAGPEVRRGLARTAAALRSGTPWRIVLLGDSIVNDSFTSAFAALVQRRFPVAALNWTVSVKGSTGCPFYGKDENYRNYVSRHRPDLLLIGGISNFPEGNSGATQALADVVRRARTETDADVAIMTPAPSVVPAIKAGMDAPWRELALRPDLQPFLDDRPQRAAAEAAGVALWDLTTPLQDYLAAHPGLQRNRDAIHNDDLGKQLIGRRLAECFAALTPA